MQANAYRSLTYERVIFSLGPTYMAIKIKLMINLNLAINIFYELLAFAFALTIIFDPFLVIHIYVFYFL